MQRVLQHHLDEACRAYGIVPLGEYVALRSGYVALVHRVRGEDGRNYVLKTYDDARPISRMILPTLEALTQATVWLEQQQMVRGRIVAPVAHHNPVRSGPYTTVIFPYIDGVTPRERTLTPTQLRNLVHTVAHLHRLPADGAGLVGVPREDFDALWTSAVLPALARIDQPGHVLAAVFAGRAPRLAAQFRTFRSRAAQLATQEHALVVCHTDIHGYNVVIKNDVPLLIDWEGMKVAPKEHDLLFWIADDRWEDIWQQYRLVHPGAQIDTALLDFYGTRRLFEDLIQDIERVEQEHPTGQEFVDLCRQIDYATTELAAKPL